MTRVERITGVPGAGKSYVLTTIACDEAADRSWSDVRFVTFTSSHARDMYSDMKDRFGELRGGADEDEEEAFDEFLSGNVTTLHSWALSQTSVGPSDVIELGDSLNAYTRFWRPRGVHGKGMKNDPLRIKDEGRDMSQLAKIIGIDQWLEQHTVDPSPSSVQWAPFDVDVSASWLADALIDWRDWKVENEYYEHHDYLRMAVEIEAVPNESVVLIDEMQDYSPLEYLVVQNWVQSGDPDRIVVAGDPAQTIFRFKGARSEYLTDLPADNETRRSKSYRCPSEIASVARAVYPESGIKARQDGGVVKEVSIDDPASLSELVIELGDSHEGGYNEYSPTPYEGDVMVLARTNRHVGMIMSALHRHGVPYSSIGGKTRRHWQDDGDHYPWTDGLCSIVQCLRDVRSGDDPTATFLIEPVLDAVPGHTPAPESVESLTEYMGEDTAKGMLERMQLSRREDRMVREALQRDIGMYPSRIKIGTIHEAKGREAPAVVLAAGYPSRLEDRWKQDEEFREEERRLYYVAASRASETLAVAYDFCGGTTMPLFDGGIPRADREVVA